MIKVCIKNAWYSREKPVISDFSLEVRAGETVTVRGPSGSGKSTLLSVIAGLHRDYEGSVEARGRIALMPQSAMLPPFYTLLKNTALISRALGERPDYDRAALLLASLGLGGLEKKYPHELSGGELRRAQLAQALYTQPDVLLMDEPFSALDGVIKAQVMDVFAGARDARVMAVVLVTHDDAEAEWAGGRIIELGRGDTFS